MPSKHVVSLRFFEPNRGSRATSTPVDAVAHSLSAFQRLVHVSAMRRDGWLPKHRIRPSVDIRNNYRLVCEVPKPGSYIAPIRFKDRTPLNAADKKGVLDEINVLLTALSQEDEGAFKTAIPDQTWQRFYLEALDRLSPPQATGVELEISYAGKDLYKTTKSRLFVEKLLRTPTGQNSRESVVGEFKSIDFSKREITIRHTLTGRTLSCIYEEHVEEVLLEHPRDLLLIFGTVARDQMDMPISIEQIDHIEPVDLNPVSVSEITVGDQKISPIEELNIPVSFDEKDSLYLAEIDHLGLFVFGETREMLETAIENDIVVLWSQYACQQDNRKLTRAANALKNRVLATFQEIS